MCVPLHIACHFVYFSADLTPIWIGIGVGVPVLLAITGVVVALVVMKR